MAKREFFNIESCDKCGSEINRTDKGGILYGDGEQEEGDVLLCYQCVTNINKRKDNAA